MPASTAAKRPRRLRTVLITLGSVIGVFILLTAIAVFILPNIPGTGRVSASPEPTPTHTPAPGVASGCVGGRQIDAATVIAEQAHKDMTPTGAVTLAGAFHQFTALAPTASAADLDQVVRQITAGTLQSQELDALAKLPSLPNGAYGDTSSHNVSLADGRYTIDSATSSTVTVTLFGQMVTDGKLQHSSAGGQVLSAVTYTLESTWNGWVITAGVAPSKTAAELTGSGTAFVGGC